MLRPHKWVPEVPVVTREEPRRNSRKTRRFSPQRQLRLFFCCSIFQEIAPSLLSPERVLDTLEATQEVHRHPCLHTRGKSSVPPQLKKTPGSPSSSREEGPFPCFVREGILALPSHLNRWWSPLDAREEVQGSCYHFKGPPMSQCIQDTPDSPELTRRSPRSPTQNTMAVVTALWCLERKPLTPMVNATGSLTLLF